MIGDYLTALAKEARSDLRRYGTVGILLSGGLTSLAFLCKNGGFNPVKPRYSTVDGVMQMVNKALSVPREQWHEYGNEVASSVTESRIGSDEAECLAQALTVLGRLSLSSMPSGADEVVVTALIGTVEEVVDRKQRMMRERREIIEISSDSEEDSEPSTSGGGCGKRRNRRNEPTMVAPVCPIMGPGCLQRKVGVTECGHMLCSVCWDNHVKHQTTHERREAPECPECRTIQRRGLELACPRIFFK